VNRLKLYRIERGLSQIELAEAANCPRHVIVLAENAIRIPEKKYQEALSEALGIPLGKLFGDSQRQCVQGASK
jgi:transcriptional regulator with XRE-family HTH domain